MDGKWTSSRKGNREKYFDFKGKPGKLIFLVFLF